MGLNTDVKLAKDIMKQFSVELTPKFATRRSFQEARQTANVLEKNKREESGAHTHQFLPDYTFPTPACTAQRRARARKHDVEVLQSLRILPDV